ncbi:hypothetical protein M758_9G170100 [Ceratodon purpureus]|nr:hypothetical protein M758_9G170100 [Ceratodon purpureus]
MTSLAFGCLGSVFRVRVSTKLEVKVSCPSSVTASSMSGLGKSFISVLGASFISILIESFMSVLVIMEAIPHISAPPQESFDIEQAGSAWEQHQVSRRISTDDPERRLVISGPAGTTHSVGQDPWWAVGFHLVAAVNTAFILGYPALILAYLGWTTGLIFILGGAALSFYNNCLLGSLHEINGVRHIRYRDLAETVYGPFMSKLTWFVQYSNISIANVGLIILGGQSLKAISGITGMHLAPWIFIAGTAYLCFATVVPNLSALRHFSAFSLALSFTYTMVAVIISIKDGLQAAPRNYSLPGTTTNQAFNAIGALATIAFAFNTGMLPEMQATIKSPTSKNINKALWLQFTVGSVPFILLTIVGYWAYGNMAFPYLLINLSGPKWAITLANVTALLQALVVFHIYATPMYEFLDTSLAQKMFPVVKAQTNNYSFQKIASRFLLRGIFIGVSTFLGALLPFFGDFIALTGSMAAFTLQGGLIHHMIIKVRGTRNLGPFRLAWHWSNVVVNVIVTFATVAAAIHYLVHDASMYHAFADI